MATHSTVLAWRIPWTEEPSGLQSIGSQSWTLLRHLAIANIMLLDYITIFQRLYGCPQWPWLSYTQLGLDYRETNLDDSRKDQILHLGLHQFSTLSSLQVFILGLYHKIFILGSWFPGQGLKPRPLALKVLSPNHRTARQFPTSIYWNWAQ